MATGPPEPGAAIVTVALPLPATADGCPGVPGAAKVSGADDAPDVPPTFVAVT